MPVATVSREPGRIEAKNGADLAGAQPRDQAVEAGPCHRSTCRAAEIIIDDFDIDEAPLAGVDSDAKCNATSARAHQGKPDFPSSFAAFRWISGMRRRLRGKENREGSKRSGIALRVGIQAARPPQTTHQLA